MSARRESLTLGIVLGLVPKFRTQVCPAILTVVSIPKVPIFRKIDWNATQLLCSFLIVTSFRPVRRHSIKKNHKNKITPYWFYSLFNSYMPNQHHPDIFSYLRNGSTVQVSSFWSGEETTQGLCQIATPVPRLSCYAAIGYLCIFFGMTNDIEPGWKQLVYPMSLPIMYI